MEFSLIFFTEFAEWTKKIGFKGLLYLNLLPFVHASVIYHISLNFSEFNESSPPFKENPIHTANYCSNVHNVHFKFVVIFRYSCNKTHRKVLVKGEILQIPRCLMGNN